MLSFSQIMNVSPPPPVTIPTSSANPSTLPPDSPISPTDPNYFLPRDENTTQKSIFEGMIHVLPSHENHHLNKVDVLALLKSEPNGSEMIQENKSVPFTLRLPYTNDKKNTNKCPYCCKVQPEKTFLGKHVQIVELEEDEDLHDDEECPMYCSICGESSYHQETACDTLPHTADNDDAMMDVGQEHAPQGPPLWCLFCAKYGHIFEDCELREYYRSLNVEEHRQVDWNNTFASKPSTNASAEPALNCCNCGGMHNFHQCSKSSLEEFLIDSLAR